MIRHPKRRAIASIRSLEAIEAGHATASNRNRMDRSSLSRRRKRTLSNTSQRMGIMRSKWRRLWMYLRLNYSYLQLFSAGMATIAILLIIWDHFLTIRRFALLNLRKANSSSIHYYNHESDKLHLVQGDDVDRRPFSWRPHEQAKSKMHTKITTDEREKFLSIDFGTYGVFQLPENTEFDWDYQRTPDYGDLEISFFEEDGAERQIYHDDDEDETAFRSPDQNLDDDLDEYYYDDDFIRGQSTALDEEGNFDSSITCRKISEHNLNFQNCNEFHQLDALDPVLSLTYINEGTYRQVFGISHDTGQDLESLAVKDIHYHNDMLYDDYEYVRMDAVVAERLTSSPHTYDIYGYCGLGIISEFFLHGDIEEVVLGGDEGYMRSKDLRDEMELKPQNSLSGIKKLVLALEMAEGIANLHGHNNGLIIHDDIQLSQFLLNKDKTVLKLNDFNRAEFPLFDESRNEYCRFVNGKGNGNWRSPQEYEDLPLTESIDVWSLGNNIYGLLTGLGPLYDTYNEKEFIKKILGGETSFIDPRYRSRSRAEGKLVDLIHHCWQFQPEDRFDIFEIVNYLREAVAECLEVGASRESVLQGIS